MTKKYTAIGSNPRVLSHHPIIIMQKTRQIFSQNIMSLIKLTISKINSIILEQAKAKMTKSENRSFPSRHSMGPGMFLLRRLFSSRKLWITKFIDSRTSLKDSLFCTSIKSGILTMRWRDAKSKQSKKKRTWSIYCWK